MKKLLGVLAAACTLSAYGSSSWVVSSIVGHGKVVSGHIYHTESTGIQIRHMTERRVVTSLRLICSGINVEAPIIAVYWDTMTGRIPQIIDVYIDDKLEFKNVKWAQDGPLLYTSTSNDVMLTRSLKNAKFVKVSWIDSNQTTRNTVFDMRTFNSRLYEFNTLCKSNI